MGEGGRLGGCLRVSHADRTPQGTLGIELFLFLLTCAQPWGQGQESATVPACLEELLVWSGRVASSETVST